MKPLHYKAFISYSHEDEPWARWLQKSLERYRLPRRLVGTSGAFGEVPQRLSPVFRDRADLSAASDLTNKIRGELEASETLIVICSPDAAQSRWVDEEIRYFKSLGREERILALIVDGDPLSATPGESCFPPALTGQEHGQRHEPLAADARKYADGRSGAKLKLVAGILGIRLDELRRRDAQRRRKNWLLASASSALLFVLIATLTITALSSKREAQLQRAGTEDLLSYMLGNLKRLDPIVGLEVIDKNDEQVMNYLQNLGFRQMDNEQLVAVAQEWRLQGRAFHDRGELDAAMEPFQKSRAAFVELYQREGASKRALFELGQAEFWVGYVHMDKGELDEAEASFSRYGAITRRLINADPNNAEMVMELAYTLVNLSALEHLRLHPDIDKSLQLIQSALQYNQIALVLDPGNSTYRTELSAILAFVADAWLETCDLGKAYQFRQQNVELTRQLAEELPQDDSRKMELAIALSGLAGVQRKIALTDQALEGLHESERLLEEIFAQDCNNRAIEWQILLRRQRAAWILATTGETEQAWQDDQVLALDFSTAFDAGMSSDFNAAVDLAEFKINHSAVAHRLGKSAEAETALNDAIQRLIQLVREKPQNRVSRYQLARASFERWEQTGQSPSAEINALLQGFLPPDQPARSCDDASLAARIAVMKEDMSLARDYTAYLLGKGFFEPEFAAFCKEYATCE